MLQTLKNLYHLIQSFIANLYYGFPSQKLKVIGVTGTDGKTTTAHLIYHILKSSGKKVSLISSVYANIAGKTYDTGFHVTTPDVFPLYRFLRQSVDAGDEYFVLETTSHALSQNRTALINYEAGVLTNITHEHLDFHKKFEEYVKSKVILFSNSKIALLNADDKSFPLIKKILDYRTLRVRGLLSANPEGSQAQKIYTYGIVNKADYNLNLDLEHHLNLTKFNNYNYLAAYSLCKILGMSEKKITEALKTFKLPPGRLELVVKEPIKVIIDFAHTPNALHQVLSAVKERFITSHNRLIHVFGAAGRRDQSKRPFMGKESARYADIIILTEEDYRDEDPQKICQEIAKGIKKNYSIITDRKIAIEKDVEIVKSGDVIILTGKSHEKSLCRGKKEYPWNEHEAVKKALLKKSQLQNPNYKSSSKSKI